jgi:hypothetical protein
MRSWQQLAGRASGKREAAPPRQPRARGKESPHLVAPPFICAPASARFRPQPRADSLLPQACRSLWPSAIVTSSSRRVFIGYLVHLRRPPKLPNDTQCYTQSATASNCTTTEKSAHPKTHGIATWSFFGRCTRGLYCCTRSCTESCTGGRSALGLPRKKKTAGTASPPFVSRKKKCVGGLHSQMETALGSKR